MQIFIKKPSEVLKTPEGFFYSSGASLALWSYGEWLTCDFQSHNRTRLALRMLYTLLMGCRNEFGMTLSQKRLPKF